MSEVHENAPQLKSKLADLMCHSDQTAAKSYRLVEREKSSLVAAKHSSIAMQSSTTTALPTMSVVPESELNITDAKKIK